MDKLVQRSLLNALGTAAYIVLAVLIISNIERLLGQEENILMPISALMFFVLSAATTGSLVLGKPIMMYFNGEKSDAVRMFIYTVGWLALFTVIAFIISVSI